MLQRVLEKQLAIKGPPAGLDSRGVPAGPAGTVPLPVYVRDRPERRAGRREDIETALPADFLWRLAGGVAET